MVCLFNIAPSLCVYLHENMSYVTSNDATIYVEIEVIINECHSIILVNPYFLSWQRVCKYVVVAQFIVQWILLVPSSWIKEDFQRSSCEELIDLSAFLTYWAWHVWLSLSKNNPYCVLFWITVHQLYTYCAFESSCMPSIHLTLGLSHPTPPQWPSGSLRNSVAGA